MNNDELEPVKREKYGRGFYILIAVIALLGLLLIGSLVNSPEPEPQPNEAEAPASREQTEPKRSMMDNYERGFMTECERAGGTEEFCDCAFSYLDEHLTDQELIDLSVQVYESEEPPAIFLDLYEACSQYVH